jgi:hypothetical protein
MRAALGKRQSTPKKIRPVNPITRYGKAVGSIFRWLVFEEASLIGNDQEAPMSGPGRQITVTIPHDVGFDLKKIQKIQADLVARLGHTGCYSGFDILFKQEQEFMVNPGSLDLHVSGR